MALVRTYFAKTFLDFLCEALASLDVSSFFVFLLLSDSLTFSKITVEARLRAAKRYVKQAMAYFVREP